MTGQWNGQRRPDRHDRWLLAVLAPRAGMTNGCRAVLTRLSIGMSTNGIISVPQKRLADDLGIAQPRVSKSIALAKKLGFLDVVKRPRQHTTAVYQAIIPPASEIRPDVPLDAGSDMPFACISESPFRHAPQDMSQSSQTCPVGAAQEPGTAERSTQPAPRGDRLEDRSSKDALVVADAYDGIEGQTDSTTYGPTPDYVEEQSGTATHLPTPDDGPGPDGLYHGGLTEAQEREFRRGAAELAVNRSLAPPKRTARTLASFMPQVERAARGSTGGKVPKVQGHDGTAREGSR